MKWIYNDGGRSFYYKASNVRDCVCRAIAIANDEDYKVVYIADDGEVVVNHLQPKELLDKLRYLCKGKSTPDMEICKVFNDLTNDGKNMQQYSDLLSEAIKSIIDVKEESDIDSFLSGIQGSLFTEEIKGLDDFELICFLVIQ